MKRTIYRDALSAWRGLGEIGGLEPSGRDEDFALQIKDELDPRAENLDLALRNTSMELFLNAFFQATQPFAKIFQDILEFFEEAGARKGQQEWRLSVGDTMADLSHFEEFLEHWETIECEVEVPALDRSSAFTMNEVRIKIGGFEYLREDDKDGPVRTGFSDVDDWLAAYDRGEYAQYPLSLHPDNFGPGLADAARTVVAALSVIHTQGLDREEMLSQHRARSYASVERDAFHPWTIAQNETDFWLRSSVRYLARLLGNPEKEREAFGDALADAFGRFPRRKYNARIEAKDLERLLSLPAWKRRYEFYGVWVATEIINSLKGHDVRLHHENGKLEFAFRETRIADINTARPKVALFSERKTPLSDPVGKSRKENVQPDYGLWTSGSGAEGCLMIVEVKHYKRRSRRNFRSVLVDYARAHSEAEVVLVNYGPVGKSFADLPSGIDQRCNMIGYMNPQNGVARESFRKLVRQQVGEPITLSSTTGLAAKSKAVAVDVSGSMREILNSKWFDNFLNEFENTGSKFHLIDNKLRTIQGPESVRGWLSENSLGGTALAGPIGEMLSPFEKIIVVTDGGGVQALSELDAKVLDVPLEEEIGVKLLEITRVIS